MSKIRIVTDTNSGITLEMAKEIGVTVLPMPFFIDGVPHTDGVDCTYEEFFKKLRMGADVSTSQPSPGDLCDLWDKVLEDYDELVYIPMSEALSSSCETAIALSANYNGKVQVVNNRRISITLYQSILDALRLAEYGMNAAEIKAVLERESAEQSIYITVNTLELLKKSGRVTKAAAGLATVLNLKPVLQIQGGKLDTYKKARGMDKARLTMIDAIKNDLETRFKGKKVQLALAYSGDREPAEDWAKQFKAAFPEVDNIIMHALPISICCHTGDGALAAAVSKVL
ncbi:MAG: DegV family protein [Clostridia bacterium]|nr:DegV family protein [Clostridia bacterium]